MEKQLLSYETKINNLEQQIQQTITGYPTSIETIRQIDEYLKKLQSNPDATAAHNALIRTGVLNPDENAKDQIVTPQQ